MCGINGIIYKDCRKVKREDIEIMNETLKHRGPDDKGVFLHKNVGLGHTRLSIIDLSRNGHQPMKINEYIIVYNGEIYNFKELKKEYFKNEKFLSNTDTEVILRLFIKYGISILSKLNGMFAFCIYDIKKGKIYLARDRFGIKPLYLYEDKEKLIFSSEIKAILKITKDYLNKEALKQFFQFHYIFNPYTPFKNIKKLTPSSYLEIDLNSWNTVNKTYYQIAENSEITDEKTAIEKVEKILENSVQKRLISDVEIGCFLSGGVDSSLITVFASKNVDKQLKTFSITFKNLNNFFDESEYAKAVSKKYGTKHFEFSINFEDVFKNLEEIIYHLDEPLADTSIFLNYYISKYTKEYVKVSLSGIGGDELFGGYNRHQAFLIAKRLKYLRFLRSLLSKIEILGTGRTNRLKNYIRLIYKLISSLGNTADETYLNMISYNRLNDRNLGITDYTLKEILKFDLKHYLSDNLLNFTDKMSMAHSLEVRTPFLDYRLVNTAFSIGDFLKTTFFEKKIILKKLASKYIDKNIVYRRKQGFSAPIEIWFRQKGEEAIKNLIDFKHLSQIIDKSIIEKDLYQFFHRNKDKSLQIFSYIVFSIWYKLNRENIINE